MNRRRFVAALGAVLASVPVLGRLFKGKGTLVGTPDEPESSLAFYSGMDCPGDGGGKGGSILFVRSANGEKVLEFCPNGDFVYRGRKVKTDVELHQAFRRFLKPWFDKAVGQKPG